MLCLVCLARLHIVGSTSSTHHIDLIQELILILDLIQYGETQNRVWGTIRENKMVKLVSIHSVHSQVTPRR